MGCACGRTKGLSARPLGTFGARLAGGDLLTLLQVATCWRLNGGCAFGRTKGLSARPLETFGCRLTWGVRGGSLDGVQESRPGLPREIGWVLVFEALRAATPTDKPVLRPATLPAPLAVYEATGEKRASRVVLHSILFSEVQALRQRGKSCWLCCVIFKPVPKSTGFAATRRNVLAVLGCFQRLCFKSMVLTVTGKTCPPPVLFHLKKHLKAHFKVIPCFSPPSIANVSPCRLKTQQAGWRVVARRRTGLSAGVTAHNLFVGLGIGFCRYTMI